MIEQGEFPDRDGGGGGHTHPGPAGALRACGAGLDAAKRKFPKENLELRKKAQIMHRHDGAPNPEPEAAVPDPDLLDWDVNLIRGKKADFKGNRDGEGPQERDRCGDRAFQASSMADRAPCGHGADTACLLALILLPLERTDDYSAPLQDAH